MSKYYKIITNGGQLSSKESEELMYEICSGQLPEHKISFLLGIYKNRKPELNEIRGFKDALLNLCIKLDFQQNTIDVCGTGGDGKNTFNISTLSAFILAASGIPVTKHGNFGSTSVSGSSDILNYFGYKFKSNQEELKKELNDYNLTIIHAPNFHPALKSISLIRKSIGTPSFFNILGPLINPSQPKYRYIGVFNKAIARDYFYLHQDINCDFTIVHSIDGYDEISLTSDVLIQTNNSSQVLKKHELHLKTHSPMTICAGNSITDAANIFKNVIENKATIEQINTVLINSAYAMNLYTKKSIEESIEVCRETIESGNAKKLFKNFILN